MHCIYNLIIAMPDAKGPEKAQQCYAGNLLLGPGLASHVLAALQSIADMRPAPVPMELPSCLQPSGASGSPAATPAALDDVAAYLTDSGAAARQDAGGDQERSSSPVFRPGWEVRPAARPLMWRPTFGRKG